MSGEDAPGDSLVPETLRRFAAWSANGAIAGAGVGFLAVAFGGILAEFAPSWWFVPFASGAGATIAAGELAGSRSRYGVAWRAGPALLAPYVGAGLAFVLAALADGLLPFQLLMTLDESSRFNLAVTPAIVGVCLALAFLGAGAFASHLGRFGRAMVVASLVAVMPTGFLVLRFGAIALLLPHVLAAEFVALTWLVERVWRLVHRGDATSKLGRIPFQEGRAPPMGSVLVDDPEGRRFYVDPKMLKLSPERSTLSSEQVRRIAAFKEALGAHDRPSLEQTLSNFRRDANPETEIRIWEHITKVFKEELAARAPVTPEEERLLYVAALSCSLVGAEVGNLISAQPMLKGLRDLEAVVARWKGGP
ncbi:MAG: hypothetical protein ACAI25_01505 [Planctomycetota bacterium]